MDKDRPIEEVCALLRSLLKDDANQIIFCTGRVEDYREKTIEQINKILKGRKNIDIDSEDLAKKLIEYKVPKREIAKIISSITKEKVNSVYDLIKNL